MDDVLEALAAQHAELAGLVDGLDDEGWARPSRCEGWSIADVVLHLAQTDEMALASVQGRLPEALYELTGGLPAAPSIDEGAALMVARDRAAGPAAVYQRWRRSSAAMREAFAACDPGAKVQWVVGELAARTLATTRLAECWIHTGDVADGLGVEPAPSDRLWHIARLAWRTLPWAFTREGRSPAGPVAFRLTGPGGEAWDFGEDDAATVVRGSAVELCRVASRRVPASETGLSAEGPDAADVLALVRTWA